MCLYILSKHIQRRWLPFLRHKVTPAVLRNHLVVYKVVRQLSRGTYVSPYRDNRLTLGVALEYVNMRPTRRWTRAHRAFKDNFEFNPFVIEAGWHAMLSKAKAESMASAMGDHPLIGVHRVIAGVIPAGSQVFYGEHDEVVAETMILFNDNEQAARWIVDHPVRRK